MIVLVGLEPIDSSSSEADCRFPIHIGLRQRNRWRITRATDSRALDRDPFPIRYRQGNITGR
jgi:hypothetical protein